MNYLFLYQTTDGQTLRITERLAQKVAANDHRVQIENLDQLPAQLALDDFDVIIVGASIRYGKHRPQVADFFQQHKAVLAQKRTAFFTVNVVARKPEKNTPETNPYIQKWLQQTGAEVDTLAVFAGRLLYPDYGFFDRFMIRLIMKITQGPTDISQKYEFTDWDKVDAFANALS